MQEENKELNHENIEEITVSLGNNIENIRILASRKINAILADFGLYADVKVEFKTLTGEE
jgi:hypothetical protein